MPCKFNSGKLCTRKRLCTTPRDQIFVFEKTLKNRGINVTIRSEQGQILMQHVVNSCKGAQRRDEVTR